LKESLTLLRDRVNNAENDVALTIGGKRPRDDDGCLRFVFVLK